MTALTCAGMTASSPAGPQSIDEQAAIDAALRRIEEGEYGNCLKCGDDVAQTRLDHAPTVTTCIECAREA
jgi:RNA polymerase-binding transcription factor DksA